MISLCTNVAGLERNGCTCNQHAETNEKTARLNVMQLKRVLI